MVRISKQAERRSISTKSPRVAGTKTGRKKDHLSQGFKPKENSVEGAWAEKRFIGKVK